MSIDFELKWVKPPRQDRSRQTHDRFVDAALRLLARGRSFASIGVADLAREAGSSVGAFYSRFRDKDALLHTLQIQLYREAEATVAEVLVPARWTAVPLATLVHAFVELTVRTYREQHGLRRALLLQMGTEAEFRARAVALSKLTCDGLVAVLGARVPDVDAHALAVAVDVCHRLVYGLLDQELVFTDGPPTGRALDAAALVAELTCACVGYLERRLGVTIPG